MHAFKIVDKKIHHKTWFVEVNVTVDEDGVTFGVDDAHEFPLGEEFLLVILKAIYNTALAGKKVTRVFMWDALTDLQAPHPDDYDSFETFDYKSELELERKNTEKFFSKPGKKASPTKIILRCDGKKLTVVTTDK